jgi:uncharacterized membrane protein YgcG
MKLASISIILGALISNFATAWDEDKRCTGGRRELEGVHFDLNEHEGLQDTKVSGTNLRGPMDGALEVNALYVSDSDFAGKAVDEAMDNYRELQSTSCFELKLYWQEGYCWQEEWNERRWCLECQGSGCNENDYLVIEKCSSSSKQKFVYEGGRLKPFTSQGLCWERTGRNARQLKKCSTSSKQIINGITLDGIFEMHPNGYPDDCLSNEHHPKSQEIIRGEPCSVSRNDKTSLWQMINRGSGCSGSGGSGGGGGSGGTPARDKGSEYCDTTPCGLCEVMYSAVV